MTRRHFGSGIASALFLPLLKYVGNKRRGQLRYTPLPTIVDLGSKSMDAKMPPIVARLELPIANVATRLRTIRSDCRGYIDPGSGSYILQVALAGILGAAFAVKSYWTSIKTAIRRKLTRRK